MSTLPLETLLLLRDTLDHVNLLIAGTWLWERKLPRTDGIPVPQDTAIPQGSPLPTPSSVLEGYHWVRHCLPVTCWTEPESLHGAG